MAEKSDSEMRSIIHCFCCQLDITSLLPHLGRMIRVDLLCLSKRRWHSSLYWYSNNRMSNIRYTCKPTIESEIESDFPLLSPSGNIKFPDIEEIKDQMIKRYSGLTSSMDLSQSLLHRITTVLCICFYESISRDL